MECKKCKVKISGGFHPTGFSFPPCRDCFGDKIESFNLCRPCYEFFWKEFSKMQDFFIDSFFGFDTE
jgi:hypothetical protein